MLGSALAVLAFATSYAPPSTQELEARLARVGSDRTLTPAPPSATLTSQKPVLCSDSTAPYYRWEYSYDAPFPAVSAFYADLLGHDGWSVVPGSAAPHFTKRFGDWKADTSVEPHSGGYVLTTSVDDGYESGCAK